MRIQNNRVIIKPIPDPKKITATKIPAILKEESVRKYTTPFQIWCDLTRVYPLPFEDNKYTNAGKAIEPKQLAYFREHYNVPNLITPQEKYGDDLKYIWDFYSDKPIFGGKWDSITVETDDPNKIRRIIECKTAQEKKRDFWDDNKIPENYRMQAALYAYLSGVDGVTYIATFLKPEDYNNPSEVVLNEENTILRQMFLSRDYPEFEEKVYRYVKNWYEKYVLTGISPEYDPNNAQDKKIVTELINRSLETACEKPQVL